jgi:hypothetical protein
LVEHPDLQIGRVKSSGVSMIYNIGGLAQLVEHLPCTQGVKSSSLLSSTIKEYKGFAQLIAHPDFKSGVSRVRVSYPPHTKKAIFSFGRWNSMEF